MDKLKLPFNYLLMAFASVILVSIAQLSMKWGMALLHQSMNDSLRYLQDGQFGMLFSLVFKPVLGVFAGLGSYALSMAFWIVALKKIPLSLAYPILSLSYVLVYLGAVFLPWLNEPLSLMKGAGILLILTGLFFIFSEKKETVVD